MSSQLKMTATPNLTEKTQKTATEADNMLKIDVVIAECHSQQS